MKKIFSFLGVLAACSVLLILCPGCMKMVRLKDRAIVQAAGVDYQDGKYRLTLQYFVPEGSGGQTAVDVSKSNGNIIEAEGDTLTEAVANASLSQGKQIFFGNNRVIVIGKEMAQRDIQTPINFFNANQQLHPSVYLFVSQEDAREIVSAKIDRGIVPASTLEQIADTALKEHYILTGLLPDIVSRLQNPLNSVSVPQIQLVEEGENPKIHIQGAALIQDGKMVDTLSEDEVLGAMWVEGKTEHNVMVVSGPEGEKYSLNVLSSSSKNRPYLKPDGSLRFEIHIESKSVLREITSLQPVDSQEDMIQKIQKAQESKIRFLVYRTLEKTVSEHDADIFRINMLVRKYLPEYYTQNKENLDEILKNMEFLIDIQCDIDRIGLDATGNKR